MIELKAHADGVLLPVRAQAGSRKNEIRGCQDGELKVAVTAVAEKGKANQAILELLAKSLGLKKSELELVSGATSNHKQFVVRGIALETLRQRVESMLSD